MKPYITKTICSGGLANESLFAIILYCYKQLSWETRTSSVISAVTHIADWNRMSSVTSPYLFKEETERDVKFIDTELERNEYAMFIRKVAPEYPNEILRHYIYEHGKELDDKLVIREPAIFVYSRYKSIGSYVLFLLFAYLFYYFFM